MTEEILIDDEFVIAYVSDPGELSYQDALELATERDREATEQFLASVFDW
ncbi:MAG: hypothetical protein LLG42_03475 [Chloroflexi bacterium]|nr:hypothetical protein [Chloroflexota bacterium]